MVKEELRPFGVEYVTKKQLARIEGNFAYACKISELPEGKATSIALSNFRIAIFRVEGQFFATKDACPHAEYPLSKSTLKNDVVTCASHSWSFNVKTGQCLKGDTNISIRTFPVVIQGEEIWVKIKE